MCARDIGIVFSGIYTINCNEVHIDGIGIISPILLGVNLREPPVHNYIVRLMCFCFQENFQCVSDIAQLKIHLRKPFLLRKNIRIGASGSFEFRFYRLNFLNKHSLSPVDFNPSVIHLLSEKCVRGKLCGFCVFN